MKSIHLRLLGLLQLILCAASPLFAANLPAIAPLGELRQELRAPTSLAVDAAGNLFVADRRRHAILQFDPAGTLKKRFASAPVSGSGLAVAADGRLLLVAGKHAVNIIDTASSDLIGRLGAEKEFGQAGSIAIDTEGRVFVADRGTRSIKVYRLLGDDLGVNGQLEYSFGEGRFASIFAMAIDRSGNNLYVADGMTTDSGQPRVEVFSLDGSWQRTLHFNNSFGADALGFVGAIGFDDAGRTYIADKKSGNLRILTSDGQFLGSLLLSGHKTGDLWQPRGLAYSPTDLPGSGMLMIANSDGRVSIFGLDGAELPVLDPEPETDPAITPLAAPEEQIEETVARLRELSGEKQRNLIRQLVRELSKGRQDKAALLANKLAKRADGELATAAIELRSLLTDVGKHRRNDAGKRNRNDMKKRGRNDVGKRGWNE